MNILMLTSVYPQPDDGSYKTTPTVKYFCEEWAKIGHRVIVIHNGSKFPAPLYFIPTWLKNVLEKKIQIQFPGKESRKDISREEAGVKIYRLNMLKYKPHAAYSSSAIRKQSDKIVRILENEAFVPEVIVGHWANPQVPIISYLKKNYYPTAKSAVVFHNDCNAADVKRYSLLEYIESIDHVGCRNKAYGNTIKDNLHIQNEVFMCPSGIPDAIVNNVDINTIINNKKTNAIIYVGRLVKYKKVDSIIEGIHRSVLNDTFSLEIIGNGSDSKSIEDLIKNYCYADRVRMISKLSRDEVFQHMAKSECFTMISENEVFGMVYLEAMLMGCITIATRGGALDGIIEDGKNGFLCNSGDYIELAKIYDKIYTMSLSEKHEMMAQAYKTAAKYSDRKVAERYIESVLDLQ